MVSEILLFEGSLWPATNSELGSIPKHIRNQLFIEQQRLVARLRARDQLDNEKILSRLETFVRAVRLEYPSNSSIDPTPPPFHIWDLIR